MKLEVSSKIIVGLYALTSVFWVVIYLIAKNYSTGEEELYNLRLFTQIPLAVIPIIGGLFGLRNASNWGGIKSVMGRSTFFLSLGLLAWGGGMVVWNYYIFFANVEIPYPSYADVGYAFGLLFLVIGVLYLSKAIGTRFALRSKRGKIFLFVVPLVIALISIYLLVGLARGWALTDLSGGYLKLFFDLLYPLGDVVILAVVSLIYLLSKDFLGGIYKNPTLILLIGFLMFYISDFMFSYTTTKEIYFNGHLVDFLFTTTMFILGLGLSMLSPRISRSLKANQS